MSPYARHKYFEQNKPAIIADLLEDVAAARKKWHLSNNAAYANQWMRDAIIRSKKPGNSLYIANIHRTPPPVVSPYATRAAESANKLGEELAREQQRQQTAKPVPTLMEQFSQALAKIEKETSYWNDEKKVLYVRGFLDATLILVGSNHA
jgi:exonuclease I